MLAAEYWEPQVLLMGSIGPGNFSGVEKIFAKKE